MSRQQSSPTHSSWLGTVLVAAIRGYQRWISPAIPPRCRFYPSCSEYALQAIRLHGAVRGSWLAARRLVKCQPLHPGGVDHVPPATGRSGARRADRTAAVPTRPSERGSL